MRPSTRTLSLAANLLAVVGLAASLASLVDDLGAAPTFCAATGCETVRASAWARPLGIPMSVLGIAFFGAALALGAIHAPRLRRALAVAGGAWAVWLIALQAFAIGAWCKLCLVADPAAIGYAVCVLAGAGTARPTWRRIALAAPALGAAVLGLGLWTRGPAIEEPAAPTARAPAARPVDGVVEIVEYVDFECPFCRELQRRLDEALARTTTPVRVVRKMVPLPNHPHARDAALAWCCADAQGLGDAMARALFAADPATLTPEGCEEIAVRIGCDRERYRRDLASQHARVDADLAEARAAGVRGLPTIWIGGQRLTGAAHSAGDLVALIERAAR